MQVTALPNDMTLPSVDYILQTHAEDELLQANNKLMDHVDVYPDDKNEESDTE